MVSNVARLERKVDGMAAILAASERTATGTGSSYPRAYNPAGISPEIYVNQFVKSDHEASLVLEAFRKDFMPYAPFVVIPPNVDSEEFRRQKPFLFLAILMVTYRYEKSTQAEIAKNFREVLSHSMLIKGEQSLDILQGLLVCLAWSVCFLPV